MARMVPPYISDEVKSTGERMIFDLFSNDPGTKDWVVLHSLGLAKHTKRLYGEIDFVVMAPGLGIFCLEVKSGDIKREKGIWKFKNRFGEITNSYRGPFQQALEGMFSLKDAITRKFGKASRQSMLLFGSGVMFPHITYEASGVEEEWWQIYDQRSRRYPINSYIKQLANYTRKKIEEHKPSFNESDSLPKQSDIDLLVSFLRGDFERLVKPSHRLNDILAQLDKYTEEQYRCLDQLQDNQRCLFEGPAGTGKTLIALESVHRSLFEKKRTLLLCFNSLLGRWLASQFRVSDLKDKLYVGSLHSFMTKIAQKFQKDFKLDARSDEYYKYDLPILVLEAIDSGFVEPFDKIIIDEGQDLIRPEYLDVIDALLKGGLAGGSWEIYCDFERQAIYSELSAQDMLKLLESRGSFVKFRLSINCRNTRPIGEEVSLICNFANVRYLPNKFEGLPVEYYFYKNVEEEIKQLENILLTLRRQKIALNNISILSPYKLENSGVAKIDRSAFRIYDLTKDPVPMERYDSIGFATIQSFKGLENSYIILVDINWLNEEELKPLLYVGMSRARVGLFVLIDKRAEEHYNDLIRRKMV